MQQTRDINVVRTEVLPAPEYLSRRVVRSEDQRTFVLEARRQIRNILRREDERLLLILGPCSIHDLRGGLDYAERLAALSRIVQKRLLLLMRVYFEKPRTTIGWKGLIMDPQLDGSCDIPEGLETARNFLREVIELKLPTATEFLDPITPQYIADMVCWASIGARTSESQIHRQMASGLSMPFGIKNATSGHIQPAINAMKAATQPQTFLGVSLQGLASAVTTRGNPSCHIILRGGAHGPNYSSSSVQKTAKRLEDNGLPPWILVDCSHDNSGKDHANQPKVFREVLRAITQQHPKVFGLMIESNLVAGRQSFPQAKEKLTYGQSITDACIDWNTTEMLVLEAFHALENSSHETAATSDL